MFQQHYNMTKCFICHPSSRSSKMILKTLLKHLRTLSANNRIQIQQTRHYQDNQGFLSLIKLMDLERQSLNHASQTCKHSKIYNLFKRTISCNSDTLNYLCRIIASKISEKYYQIWLLECQVKNIAQRVTFHMLDQIPMAKINLKKIMNQEPTESLAEIKSKKMENLQNSQKYVTMTRTVSRPFTDTTIEGLSKKMISDSNESSFPLNFQRKK